MGPSDEFVNMFRVSVREGISNTLGGSVAETLFTLLKQPFQIYADRPGEFHRDLDRVFGPASVTLEKMISKELFHRLNMLYSTGSDLDFETCVNLARKDMPNAGRYQKK